MAGLLKSWALPKGPSMDPADKRLAVMVDDHPLEYFDFEGVIPEGYYGAGAVVIWDMGEYILIEGDDPETEFEKGKIGMELRGKILKGAFSLVKMKGKGDKNWLLMKKNDGQSQSGWIIKKSLIDRKEKKLREKI